VPPVVDVDLALQQANAEATKEERPVKRAVATQVAVPKPDASRSLHCGQEEKAVVQSKEEKA
jgi:hypothetical protein